MSGQPHVCSSKEGFTLLRLDCWFWFASDLLNSEPGLHRTPFQDNWRQSSMSQATKRKHVVKEVMEDFAVPSEQQQIVRVLGTPGNNLHEVETGDGKKFLASMPTKFRKNIWIKRGDFLIVDPIEEGEKVKAEITCILYKEHVRYLKKEGCWPERFSIDPAEGAAGDKDGNQPADGKASPPSEGSGSEEEGEDYSDLFVNTNRANYEYSESEDSEEESEEEEKEK